MPSPSDITYSIDVDADEVTFFAHTAKGEQWMGCPEKILPVADAKDYREAAEAADLIVTPYP
jgi:hypothetical protein